MLGFGCKLGPSSSHAQERGAEFGCFRDLSEAKAGFAYRLQVIGSTAT